MTTADPLRVEGLGTSAERLFDRIGTRERMAALAAYDLDSPALRRDMDELAASTAAAVGVPISLVNVVLDTVQVLVGQHGLAGSHWSNLCGGMPAEWSVCAYAVDARLPYVRTDLSRDPVHAVSPLVSVEGFRSYAGMPIVDPDGIVLGMHCAIDLRPRQFTADHLLALRAGAEKSARVLRRHRS